MEIRHPRDGAGQHFLQWLVGSVVAELSSSLPSRATNHGVP
jgi:hypothetical protein